MVLILAPKRDIGPRPAARHPGPPHAAALPAAFRWNRPLMGFYQRLIEIGKPHKLALIACVRKLVHFANAILKRGQPWRERDV